MATPEQTIRKAAGRKWKWWPAPVPCTITPIQKPLGTNKSIVHPSKHIATAHSQASQLNHCLTQLNTVLSTAYIFAIILAKGKP